MALFNCYGPTEATVFATFWAAQCADLAVSESGAVPIGWPLDRMEAYVLDEEGDFATRCNTQMAGLEKLEDKEEIDSLYELIKKHADLTKSQKAFKVLALWEQMVPKFVKVMPKDYKRVLQAIKKAKDDGLTGDDALNAAFEANARDVARIGGS